MDAARDCGFAAVSANDHLVFQTPWLDGLTALASMIARSGEMALATTVSLPVLRGPVPLAKALAAIDVLSEGRLVAALGPGSSERDYRVLGIPFEERWTRFEEALVVLRALLRGERMPETPRYYPVPPDVELAPGPHRQSGIPLWVGSWGSSAGLGRVARAGDGWLASAYNTSPERFSDAQRARSWRTCRSSAGGNRTAFPTRSRRCGPGYRKIERRVIACWPTSWPQCYGAIPTSSVSRFVSVPSGTAPSSSRDMPRLAASGSTCGRWGRRRDNSN